MPRGWLEKKNGRTRGKLKPEPLSKDFGVIDFVPLLSYDICGRCFDRLRRELEEMEYRTRVTTK